MQAPRAPQDRVQQAPIPGLRTGVSAPLEAFGGGREADARDREVQGVLGDAERIAQEERQKADQIAVQEKAAALMAEQTKLLYDPTTGALNRRGSNAFGAHQEVMDSWKNTVANLEKGLNGDAQKMAFRRMALDRQGDVDRALQQHISVETRRHDDDTTRAFVAEAGNAAVNGYSDPMEVTKNLNLQEAAIRDYAKRAGLSPEARKLMIDEANSATVRDVIFRALDKGEDTRAKEYLEAGGREMLVGKDLAKVEDAVSKWTTNGTATRLVDGFMKDATSFKGLMEKARSIENEDVRKAAEQYAKVRWHEREYEMREEREGRYTSAMVAIDNGGEQAESVEQATGATLWNSITDPKDRAEVAKAWRIKKGLESAVTDQEVYYALKTQGSNEATRKEFLETNLLRFRHKMTPQDFQELATFQAGLMKGDSKALKDAEGYLSRDQLINDFAGTIKDKDERNKFKMAVDREIDLWMKQNDSSEMPAKADIERVMNDFVKTNWSGTSKVFKERTNAEVMEAIDRADQAVQAIANSDPEELQKIIDALARNKINATSERVLELYEKGRGVKGGR